MTNRISAQASEDADLSQVKTVSDQADITDTYALYLDDESHSFEGKADKIIFPSSEAEIATIMKKAFDDGTPITIQGGRTGLTGAAVPMGGIAMNLEKLTKLNYMMFDEA
ncbi:MAG: FAD-binding oxidoreductase, partial [Candidatus Thorarchaeota archaeon]